jgi:hypothetical protein
MTVAFMALFTTIPGERIDKRAGRLLLWPQLALGAASVIWWRYADDLRWYALVQFFPMLAIVLLLRGRCDPLLPMLFFCARAKLLEWQDRAIAAVFPADIRGHIAAAAAVFGYVRLWYAVRK